MGRLGRMKIQIVNDDTASKEILFDRKTETIIGAFFDVMNELGSGFLESIYHSEDRGIHPSYPSHPDRFS